MTVVVTCDPGLSGALCLYDTQRGNLDVYDMPTYSKVMGRTRNPKTQQMVDRKRSFLDEQALCEMLKGFHMMGATHLFIEHVGGLPGQSASGAFVFGYGCATVVTAARMLGLSIERPTPQAWKGSLRVPADKQAARARASEMMPTLAHHWPLKGHDGRAEAALLALYAEKVLRK